MTLLLVGLGNPGSKYRQTRHNAGFLFLDSFIDAVLRGDAGGVSAPAHRVAWTEKFGGAFAELSVQISATDTSNQPHHTATLIAFKPLLFMNVSGRPVLQVSSHFKIPMSNWLVLHDEIDLPFSDIRLKEGGGHRGHNGLRDIMAHSGGGSFDRIRIGVGRPFDSDDSVADYVLSPFSKSEQSEFEKASKTVNSLVSQWLIKKNKL